MQLSVVIPTWNERENVAHLLLQLQQQLMALTGDYEIIVVDDGSPDDTAAVVRQCMQQDATVRLLSRSGQRGLSSALATGFDAAVGDYVLAIDADLQHDAAAVLPMLLQARQVGAELVVATRYGRGGSTAGWSAWRRMLSRLATRLVRSRLRTSCSDPLSGFFLLRRELWQRVRERIRPAGFKLLLDILGRGGDLHIAEVAYCFAPRQRGASKFSAAVMWSFLCSLWCGWS